MLEKIIGFFIPSTPSTDSEYQRRVRLIAYALFITALFSAFYMIVSWLSGFTLGILFMLGNVVIFTTLLFLLKSGINVFIIANIFGLIGILGITGSIYFSGGVDSPVLPWLATTPIVILLLAGKKSGSFWAIIAVLLIVAFGVLAHTGYVFPKGVSSQTIIFYLACQAGLVLIIYVISLIFENLRIRAFNAVSAQKDELQDALTELKTTQAQLLQSEKMASLGELTAGIAHEIQNPLNFVNNFSELNIELMNEMIEAISKSDTEEVNMLANDIKDNLDKISYHGNRANAIVKGMLMHSRKNTGEKQLTDINDLCDEYLLLSYHGLRAKDKSFNAELVTDLDKSIGKINVVPQDFGRVLLNLLNNAFYAVNEKRKTTDETYKPVVSITSRKLSPSLGNRSIEITVRDNGNGIPQNIIAKIFQPFFTTKPAGDGTGLGLSLAYDIVKAHGGEIKIDTKEQQGSAFIIRLPE